MARRKIDPEAGRATQFQTGGKQAQTAKKGGIARGERIVTPLCPNSSPARRGIAFHDSPRPRSVLEPSSGGRKSGCQKSQRSFARWFTNRCISAGGVHIFVETPGVPNFGET